MGIVTATVLKNEITDIFQLVDNVDPNPFVMVEEARTVRRGHLHIAQREK